MLPPTYLRLRLTMTLLLALGITIMALLPVGQVGANGAHSGMQKWFAGPAEPYYIEMLTVPVVGNLHMVIYVSPLGAASPMSDVRVQVLGRGPQEGAQTVGPVPATRSLTSPNWYSVDLPIEEAGGWVFTLTVESSLGEAMVDIPIEVPEPGGVMWVVVGAAAVGLGIAAWWLVLWLRQGKGRRLEPCRIGGGKHQSSNKTTIHM